MTLTKNLFATYPKEKTLVFFGKTGAGKTSSINSLFDWDWATDNAKACTYELKIKKHQTESGLEFAVVDTPGISESEIADVKFFSLYQEAISNSGHLIWVFQSDTRGYRSDQIMMLRLQNYLKKVPKISFLMNQIDLIGFGDWDKSANKPSPEQWALLEEKKEDILQKFEKYLPGLTRNKIWFYSAKHKYNTKELYSFITNQ